tara:strand:+ start:38453 stop:42481 length:4029 start_codon:yes stop_codon:yes gene_type:complete
MPFNRTETYTSNIVLSTSNGFENAISTMVYSNTSFYSDVDIKSNVIFVPITTDFDLSFSRAMTTNTVIVQTNNDDVREEFRNKKGSVAITHIVNKQLGSSEDSNNLKGFNLSSTPDKLSSQSITGDFSDEVVEMENLPSVTNSNSTFTFQPITSLSSNTTYFLNASEEDLKDGDNVTVTFDKGNGFTTDNSKSIVTTSDYYTGFRISIEEIELTDSETENGFKKVSLSVGDIFSASSRIQGKITNVRENSYDYQIELPYYKINVAYTAGLTTIVSSTNHGLTTGDQVEIYDIVSGDGMNLRNCKITKISDNSFSLDNVDTSSGTNGRLNYYTNFQIDDVFKSVNTSKQEIVNFKIVSSPIKNISELDYTNKNAKMLATKKSDGSVPGNRLNGTGGRFIRKIDDNIISFISVDDSDSDNGKIKISDTDYFSNGDIIDVTTVLSEIVNDEHIYANTVIRFHCISNSSPTHNTNPFNTSAPFVLSTFPPELGSFTSKLQILTLTRSNDTVMRVETNHPHNLSINDEIEISDSDQRPYNGSFKINQILSSTQFIYLLDTIPNLDSLESTGPVKLKYKKTSEGNFVEKLNCIQVEFSQSMNTSTISVANTTHFLYANGLTTEITSGQSKLDATVQISTDDFDTVLDCESIKSETGNSFFTIQTDTVPKGKRFKVNVSGIVKDLGSTPQTYDYLSSDGFTTGIVIVDELTGVQTIFTKDEDPPSISKISFSNTVVHANVSGKVLESQIFSEITSPSDLLNVPIDMSGETIVINFNEGMKTESISVNSQNTLPIGTIQLSCDNFNTVVEFDEPVFTDRLEENDTINLVPKANLSSNVVYSLKVSNFVSDDSPEENKMLKDNVSSIFEVTLNDVPSNSTKQYIEKEIVRGLRTLTVKSSVGTPTIGYDNGAKFKGRTSGALGQILDYESGGQLKLETGSDFKLEPDTVQDYFLILQDSDNIKSIRFNELPGVDGNYRSFINGEVCDFLNVDGTIDTNKRFSIGSTTILPAPIATTIRYDDSTRKYIYRQENLLYTFGNADRLIGKINEGKANTYDPIESIGPGFKTESVDLIANVYFRKTDDTIVSLSDGPQTGVNPTSNLIVEFNQTINTDSISINTSAPEDVSLNDSITISYDSNYQNSITFDSDFKASNNDTYFEFRPKLLTQTNPQLQLTQTGVINCRLKNTLKNKGGGVLQNLGISGNFLSFANTATIAATADFNVKRVFVLSPSRRELLDVSGDKLLGVNIKPIISVVFNEALKSETSHTYTIGSGQDIELSTQSDFSGGHYTGTTSFFVSGLYNNELLISIGDNSDSLVSTGTTYYMRINTSIENEKGVSLQSTSLVYHFQTN